MSSDRGERIEHGAPRTSDDGDHRIVVHLAEVLERRGMTLTELSERIGVTLANLSILKTGKARAVRFTTLTAICEALDTTPAELFSYEPRDD
ncbi:helix-turn-helix domain-containing protein [Agromyces cerinus]|uniref:Transcriptional regulator n=1 Tax=Agromyces cerinus subsp. cerinus TaxID=232089 RepID=A0A1N6I9K4_9MICO|nr:transcriptional regulator [Agromyces cerinus subsp. cerinus]